MNRKRITLFALLFLMVFNTLVPALHAQQPLSEMSEEERNQKIRQEIERFKKERQKYKHPKVAEALVELEEEYKKGAEEAAKRFQAGEVLKDREGKNIISLEDAKKKGAEEAAEKVAKLYRLRLNNGKKVRVVLILKPEITAELFDKSRLIPYSAETGIGLDNRLPAEIPINMIRRIADEIEEIEFIEAPQIVRPLSYKSEGVNLTGASSYQSAGLNGSGVKVAILDTGFAGLASAISNEDIPNTVIKVDCTLISGCGSASFSGETEQHGTAVAEIVHDMASEAQLYLIKISDKDSLKLAKDYCLSNGIKVINLSGVMGNTNFYDGICYYNNPVCTANSAYSNGILWVNAIGNYATQHYEAMYTDNGGSWHSTVPTIYAKAGETIEIDFTWNE